MSKREFRGLPPGDLTKAEIENRWDVKGLGWHVTKQDYPGLPPMWLYPRCGYSTDEAVYGASFDHGKLWMTFRMITIYNGVRPTPHGHLRLATTEPE